MMKIFSLEAKKHLVGWGVVFGIVINVILFFQSKKIPYTAIGVPRATDYGWPFKYNIYYGDFQEIPSTILDHLIMPYSLILNFVFWMLVTFLVLGLVRYFKTKH